MNERSGPFDRIVNFTTTIIVNRRIDASIINIIMFCFRYIIFNCGLYKDIDGEYSENLIEIRSRSINDNIIIIKFNMNVMV
jgi:hypothetical protein